VNPARYLYRGADRPSTLSELAERMGVTRREAENAVQAARMAGEPIVSGPRGLWVSESPTEVLEAAARLRSRALTQLVTARALRQTGRRMQAARMEQRTLWEAA
jgi:hypothetical protein